MSGELPWMEGCLFDAATAAFLLRERAMARRDHERIEALSNFLDRIPPLPMWEAATRRHFPTPEPA